jgi:hypothetical protein
MTIPSPLSAFLITLTGLLPACAVEDHPPALGAEELSRADQDEVAAALAVTLHRELDATDGLVSTASRISLGELPPWLRSSELGVHVGTLLGLDVEIEVACYDAGGSSMPCGPGAAAGEVLAEIDGHLALLIWTGSFGVTTSARIDGLQQDELRVATSAEIELGSQLNFGVTHETSFSISAGGEVTVRKSDHLPIAGSAEFSISMMQSRSDVGEVGRWEFVVEAVISDGQATVRIGSATFRIDLLTGTAVRM